MIAPHTKNRFRTLAGIAAIAAGLCSASPAAALTQVFDSRADLGNLDMYEHRSTMPGIAADAPLVVLLHGCDQTVFDFDDETGWVAFADQYGFNLVFAAQKPANNSRLCFNWFNPDDQLPSQGEPSSIREMVDVMERRLGAKPRQTFISGLSAGAAMAAVMLAAYPQDFSGGAIHAGVPYKCATDAWSGVLCMSGPVYKTPRQWGALVHNVTGWSGPWPRVIAFHGSLDTTVSPSKLSEIVQQWTYLHGARPWPTATRMIDGMPAYDYGPNVRAVSVTNMGHGLAIDYAGGCGIPGRYTLDVGLCSTYRTGQFWGLIP